jgi:hypothetical protein
MAVMDAFESGVLDLPDFYFTGDDYRYRFQIEAKRRFLDLLRERFNLGVGYNSHTLRWDIVIELAGSTSRSPRQISPERMTMSFEGESSA